VVNAKSPIGHLAAGLGRDQQSFFTIYHGLSSVSSGPESLWAFD